MKLIASHTSFLGVIALASGLCATACSSSSSSPNETPDSGGPTGDAGHADSGHADGGGGSIAGSLAITVTVQQNSGIAGQNTPFNACPVRIEVPGSPKLFIDAKTGTDGTATFMVDPAQAPYDITAAAPLFTAVSILGVSATVPGNIVLYPSTANANQSQSFTATGSISGKQSATNQVQLDAWDWATVSTADTSYSTTFSYTPGLAVQSPLPVAAIEEDDAGTVVNGALIGMGFTRPEANTTINIALPSTVVAPTTGMVTVAWPTTGLTAGSNVMSVYNADPSAGSATPDMYLGNGLIEQTIATEPGAGMYVGRVDVSLPTNNSATMKIQSYGAAQNLQPDLVIGAWSSLGAGTTTPAATDFATYVYLHGSQLAGGTVTLPAIRTATITLGSDQTLDSLQFAFDTDYSTSAIELADTSGGTTSTLWTIYSASGKVTARGLPHLPTATGGLVAITGDTSSLGAALVAANYISGAPSPWGGALESDFAIESNTFDEASAPMVGDY